MTELLATMRLLPEGCATHGILQMVSPCRFEQKNHDRIATIAKGDRCFAVVCDGTSTSMGAAAAAAIVTRDPIALWSDGGLAAAVGELWRRRQRLIEDESTIEVDTSSFISRTMAEIREKARQRSFQTTFVAARVTSSAAADRVHVAVQHRGDSAALIFDHRGALLWSNLPIPENGVGFGRVGSATDVLPDHYDPAASLSFDQELACETHVILCSDGFYGAFSDAGALLQWLVSHVNDLDDPQHSEAAAEELHQRLDQGNGDDDLSVIWLWPRGHVEPPTTE